MDRKTHHHPVLKLVVCPRSFEGFEGLPLPIETGLDEEAAGAAAEKLIRSHLLPCWRGGPFWNGMAFVRTSTN